MNSRARSSDRAPLCVAVTGHRTAGLREANPDLLKTRLDEVLEGIVSAVPHTLEARPLLLSGLAEGADRLVALRALAHNFALGAVLPFPAHRYEADFEDEASIQAFRDLLRRAAQVDVVALSQNDRTAARRESAYVALGFQLASRADVLIALWDGEPARGGGGTAEVVAAATERHVPVVWIDAADPHEVRAFSATHPPTVVHPPVQDGVRTVVAPFLSEAEQTGDSPVPNGDER